MASADCSISVGFRSSAEPGTTNTATCATIVGFASAASPVAWAGSDASRNVADWLPRIDEPLAEIRNGKIYVTKRWWNFYRAVADRLGGVQGPSMSQVVTSVSETQVQVAANTVYTTQVADYAGSIAATAEATAQVAQTNSLSGAGSIPSPGHPPSRPNYQVE